MGAKTKGVRRILLTVPVILLVTAGVIAALAGIWIYRFSHRETLTLYGFTTQHDDGTYYADTAGVKSPVLVESDVDLSPYLTGSDVVLNVSGEVTKVRTGHFDCMGIYLPCLTFDYRIQSVLSAEPAAEE